MKSTSERPSMRTDNGMRPYMPSSFVAAISRREAAPSLASGHEASWEIAELAPDLRITLQSLEVRIGVSQATHVARNADQTITVVVHGDLYETGGLDPAEHLLRLFETAETRCAKDLNGSFAALIVDCRRDRVVVITDRLGSRKVYHSEQSGVHWLSSSLPLHPKRALRADPAGVMCHLASGSAQNGLTPFEGVRMLARASVHTLTGKGMCADTYWQYHFTYGEPPEDDRALRQELAGLLRRAVARRLESAPYSKVYVSLSAGYDARTVLGILLSQVKDRGAIRCFSYGHEPEFDNGDPRLAAEIARHCGVEHRIIECYPGDVHRAIEANAALGHGVARFCDEVNAWEILGEELSRDSSSVLFDGDMFYPPWPLGTREELLSRIYVEGPAYLKPLLALLDPLPLRTLIEAWQVQYDNLLGCFPPSGPSRDLLDFIYLDQRIAHALMLWREHFQAPFARVYNPILDNEVLDFATRLPPALRAGKSLYARTVTEMCPDLFEVPRATATWNVPDWRSDIAAKADVLVSAMCTEPSRLDPLIPPEVCVKLIHLVKTWRDCTWIPWLRKVMKRTAIAFPRAARLLPTGSVISLETLVRRLLVIRRVLATG